jgi:predicted DNA-binding protein YlxM (UPF0122 family)
MITQGHDSGATATYYNADEPSGGGSNHTLQDYQMQLLLLEEQNKKRRMMAWQEQDNAKTTSNLSGPQNQESPMITQGHDSGATATYYNADEPSGGGSNHTLQDYQMQLLLLEQQNKRRMMARQEQDNIIPQTKGGQRTLRSIGPNNQPLQGISSQGPRSVNSPNPGDQMKRGAPHMDNAGMPSPLPEG